MNAPSVNVAHFSSTAPRHKKGEPHTAHVDLRLSTPSVVVISVRGAIDASNAGILTRNVSEHTTHCDGVVLDLAELDFFGTEGFPTLHRVSVACARNAMGWALVVGDAVSRLLRICDPQGSLPAALTVDGAIAIATSGCPETPVTDTALTNIAARSFAVSARP